jgi:adenylylsulfate reductase subunit B
MWTIKFRNGTMKRFKFPIRTTAEGSINPYGGKPAPKLADMKNTGFFTGTADGGVMKGYRAGNPSELIRK